MKRSHCSKATYKYVAVYIKINVTQYYFNKIIDSNSTQNQE